MHRTKRNLKRKHTLEPQKTSTEELEYLEKIVLGDGNDVFEEDSDEEQKVEEASETIVKEPAWVDADDVEEEHLVDTSIGNISVSEKSSQSYRENKFNRLGKKPKWAAEAGSKTKQTSILNRCGNLITKSKNLEKGHIEIKKLKDLNSSTYNEGPIRSIKFHPKSTVAMVTGLSGVVSIIQVDGRENTKLQSMKFHRFPIYCASFVNDGEELILSSKYYKYFNTFNLMTGQTSKVNNDKIDGIKEIHQFTVSPDNKFIAICGSYGKIHLLSARTKECIDNFQMNCDVTSIAFTSDSSKMYSHGVDGEVYIWDMKSRQCIQKFVDDGCIKGTAIDVSPNDSFIACGSNTGVVNVYDAESVMLNKCNPLKIFYNLVTPITDVTFNPTSEILSISSCKKDNAVKLIHLSSMTVFSNFPAKQTRLNSIQCVDFSPNSGFYALGDCRNVAHLYRLKYYGNY